MATKSSARKRPLLYRANSNHVPVGKETKAETSHHTLLVQHVLGRRKRSSLVTLLGQKVSNHFDNATVQSMCVDSFKTELSTVKPQSLRCTVPHRHINGRSLDYCNVQYRYKARSATSCKCFRPAGTEIFGPDRIVAVCYDRQEQTTWSQKSSGCMLRQNTKDSGESVFFTHC